MKKIIKALEKQQEALEEIVEKRNDKVSDASEKWQESEACEEYEDKTMDIEDQINELSCVIDGLKEI